MIRALLKQTQEGFIKNFTGMTVAKQKSYESGKAKPDILYIQELSELTGISDKELTSKKLSKADINAIVENGEKVPLGFKDIVARIPHSEEETLKKIIQIEARVNFMLVTLADIVSKVDKKNIGIVHSEFHQGIDVEAARLLNEWKNI
jgi:hypothetical protein